VIVSRRAFFQLVTLTGLFGIGFSCRGAQVDADPTEQLRVAIRKIEHTKIEDAVSIS
jgi:hypothetical protein